jgi:hypothetical protein
MSTQSAKANPPSRADVVNLVGELDDSVISAILGTGARRSTGSQLWSGL